MNHPFRSIASIALVSTSLLSLACSSDIPSAPQRSLSVNRSSNAADLLGETAYSGVIQPGQFVVCSSQSSLAAARPIITVLSALPSDRVLDAPLIQPGHCVTVFATNRRGGIVPSIQVTKDPGLLSTGSVLFDASHLTTGVDAYFANGAPVNHSRVLSGFEGAVVKFYYGNDVILCQNICAIGGHGGGGTVTFLED